MPVWYTGTRGAHNLVERHDGDAVAHLIPVETHAGKRSGGFDWGTTNARAAALARALLVDALGPEAARCEECNGTVKVVLIQDEDGEHDEPFDPAHAADYDPLDVGQCICEDGVRPLPVADFVTDHVSTWRVDWVISRREVLAWLAGEYPQTPYWLVRTMEEVSLP